MKTPETLPAGTAPASWFRRHRRQLLIGLVSVAVLLLPSACSSLTRSVVLPPEIPGATYVGSDTCVQCHQEISRDFKTASHALLKAEGPHATLVGCEGCHGPGSKHAGTGGAPRTILNPNRKPDICLNCHLDLKGQFALPHHHPVPEGRMSCTDCHNPHKGRAVPGDAHSMLNENQTCQQCHPAQRGPFVFEHEASREGCLTCHRPHGSVNPRLLTERNATLCLKCHFQQQVAGGQILIGGRDHAAFLSRGTCWSAGCHEAVHGSQVNTSLRF
ncbi:MAG: cytochrome c3 family protein [Verrucomicrobiota bacterium]